MRWPSRWSWGPAGSGSPAAGTRLSSERPKKPAQGVQFHAGSPGSIQVPEGLRVPHLFPSPLSYLLNLCQPSNAKLLLCICPLTHVSFAPSKGSSLMPCEHSWEQE